LELNNDFSLVYIPLPVNTTDPTQRLELVSKEMALLNASSIPSVNHTFFKTLRFGPLQHFLRSAATYFSNKSSLVLASVPGPTKSIYFAGGKVTSFQFFTPSVNLGLSVTIFSYAGTVSINVSTDANIISEPERLVHHFERQFARLVEDSVQSQSQQDD